MQIQRSATFGRVLGRWALAGVLTLTSLPLVSAWQAERARQSAPSPVPFVADSSAWIVPGEIAVMLKPGNGDADLADLGRDLGLSASWNSPLKAEGGVARILLPSGADAQAVLEKIRRDSRVEAADVVTVFTIPQEEAGATLETLPGANAEPERGRFKPNDPLYERQWNFRMVNAEEAWGVTKGKNVTVAVIDTGVAYADTRKGKVCRDFKNTAFVPGYDFVARDNMPNDDHGHGTHVAGTIAESTNNNEGAAGLAFEARIMPLKVLDGHGRGYSNNISEAIRWAADHGADVINMSLGGPRPDSVTAAACEYARKKGVAIVCAAGNSGREGVGYPAAYPDCIAVSAVGPNGKLSFYSSWGKQVAIAAPGGDLKQDASNGGILQNTVFNKDGSGLKDDYYQFQGTSMASPHVAAVAALVKAKGIKDPNEVKAVLQKSAKKQAPENKYGAGVLDAASAAKTAANLYGDGVTRFWFVLGLFSVCGLIGYTRHKAGSDLGAPFWGTAAFGFGLLFPDWLSGYLGLGSAWNLLGHSILIPGALLILGATGQVERRLLGWMACGLALHLGWDFLRGTAPYLPDVGTWQLLPWVAANVLIGLGMLLRGFEAKE